MQYKIGLVGSPLSGKTTLGAMLYTEFLKQGVEGAALIDEYAKWHLATGKPIKEYKDQKWISSQQILSEYFIEKTSFTPIICDSCVWLGKIYCQLNGWDQDNPEYEVYAQTLDKQTYDMTIFVPLQHTDGETSEYRVHDGVQAAKIAYLIQQELGTKHTIYAPVEYEKREEFVKQLVTSWRVLNDKQHSQPTKCQSG
jgi:ABC-type oligopeptide transport system ATPase subunit